MMANARRNGRSGRPPAPIHAASDATEISRGRPDRSVCAAAAKRKADRIWIFQPKAAAVDRGLPKVVVLVADDGRGKTRLNRRRTAPLRSSAAASLLRRRRGEAEGCNEVVDLRLREVTRTGVFQEEV